MLWSNGGGGKPPGMKPAAFADVTQKKGSGRPPAWVSNDAKKPPIPQREPAPPAHPEQKSAPQASPNPAVPRAPRVPTEARASASMRPMQHHAAPHSSPRTSLIAMEMVSPLESLRVPAAAVVQPEPSQEMIEGFAAAIATLADTRRRMLVESTQDLAKLAGMIAKRVIGREVSVDPKIVLGLVQEGLDVLGQYDRIQVRLGPDFESVQQDLTNKLRSRGVEYEVVIDSDLTPYGCVVETDLGRVDESIEARLEQLFRGLITESDNPPTV